jgi:hypothetical protein
MAASAGASRPCAIQHGRGWLGSLASGMAFTVDFRNVTKRTTRRLERHLT